MNKMSMLEIIAILLNNEKKYLEKMMQHADDKELDDYVFIAEMLHKAAEILFQLVFILSKRKREAIELDANIAPATGKEIGEVQTPAPGLATLVNRKAEADALEPSKGGLGVEDGTEG